MLLQITFQFLQYFLLLDMFNNSFQTLDLRRCEQLHQYKLQTILGVPQSVEYEFEKKNKLHPIDKIIFYNGKFYFDKIHIFISILNYKIYSSTKYIYIGFTILVLIDFMTKLGPYYCKSCI